MNNSKKNAKELHYDHRQWMSQLDEMKIELITLAKHNKRKKFIKDIGFLLSQVVHLKKIINKHEATIALAFKSCGIEDYDEIFENHDGIKHRVNSLKLSLDNLKKLFVRYHLIKLSA